MKYLNIVIFLIISTIFLLLSSHIKFSTNFLELFFSQQTVQLFEITSKLGLSNNILVSKKGFNENSLDELYEIADELKTIPAISSVTISLLPNDALKKHYKNNYYLLSDFNNTQLNKKEIVTKLQDKYNNLQNSFVYMPLNINDPLGLFSTNFQLQDRYQKLKDYGYYLKAKTTINTSSLHDAKLLYGKVNAIVQKHDETIAYAPFFFLVENSSYIRSDTQFIVTIASLLLVLLYFFMLKDYKLLANTIIAITSSVLSAIIISSLFFKEVNILVLAFGISITTISVDYMFHYYFHNEFSSKKFIQQKRVFSAFITTFGVFLIFSFIDLKLFKELAFFSLISLFVAYILFSWTFSYLNIQNHVLKPQRLKKTVFNPLYILLISAVLLIYSYQNLEFDNNLKNLDYKNTKLLALSKQFNEGIEKSEYKPILIKANTGESILQKYEGLQELYPDTLGVGKVLLSNDKCTKKLKKLKEYDFETLKNEIHIESKKIGFNDAFQNSYTHIDTMKCPMKYRDNEAFKIIKHKDTFYTVALIKKEHTLVTMDGVELFNLTKNISQDMQDSKEKIMKYIIISIVFIIIMLFIVSGLNILYPLSYVLFPLSIVLFFISLFGKINIMHLFALIILIAISIDYGIYMNKTKTLIQTQTAIRYALLSTLAGFGMLILSDTTALHSIGFVITIGICAIAILMAI